MGSWTAVSSMRQRHISTWACLHGDWFVLDHKHHTHTHTYMRAYGIDADSFVSACVRYVTYTIKRTCFGVNRTVHFVLSKPPPPSTVAHLDSRQDGVSGNASARRRSLRNATAPTDLWTLIGSLECGPRVHRWSCDVAWATGPPFQKRGDSAGIGEPVAQCDKPRRQGSPLARYQTFGRHTGCCSRSSLVTAPRRRRRRVRSGSSPRVGSVGHRARGGRCSAAAEHRRQLAGGPPNPTWYTTEAMRRDRSQLASSTGRWVFSGRRQRGIAATPASGDPGGQRRARGRGAERPAARRTSVGHQPVGVGSNDVKTTGGFVAGMWRSMTFC